MMRQKFNRSKERQKIKKQDSINKSIHQEDSEKDQSSKIGSPMVDIISNFSGVDLLSLDNTHKKDSKIK